MDTMTETHTAYVDVIGTDLTCQINVTGPYWLEAHGSQMLMADIDPAEGDVISYEIDGFTVTIMVTDWETDDDGTEIPVEADAAVTE